MASRFMVLLSLFLLLSTPVSALSTRNKAPQNLLDLISKAEKSLEVLRSIQLPKQCRTVDERRSCDVFRTSADTSLSAVIEVRKALGEWQRQVCETKQHVADCKQSAQSLASLDAHMESITQKRQELMTSFENFDQKVNQLFNLLSIVLRKEKESMAEIARNIN